jgi:sugar phosphate isomerase/epimerase
MFAPELCFTVVRKRGAGAPFLSEGSPMQGIEAAARFGYDDVEVHVRAPQELDLPAIRAAQRAHPLRVAALGTGRAYVDDGLSLIDPETQGKALERLKGFLDAAGELGAKVIVGCLRGNVPSPEQKQTCLLRLGEAMRAADEYAARRGAALLLEPINRYENNYLCSVYDAAEFIRQNKLERTRILADLFHMNIEEASIQGAIQDNLPLISYVHAADSNRLYPGGGHTDVPAVLALLKEGGFSGEISAECLPLPDDETAATRWLSNMKGYLNAL